MLLSGILLVIPRVAQFREVNIFYLLSCMQSQDFKQVCIQIKLKSLQGYFTVDYSVALYNYFYPMSL